MARDFPASGPPMWRLEQQRNSASRNKLTSGFLIAARQAKARALLREASQLVGEAGILRLLQEKKPRNHWIGLDNVDPWIDARSADFVDDLRRLVTVRWRARDRKIKAPEFLRNHYGRWFEDERFSRAVLRQVDPALWDALAKVDASKADASLVKFLQPKGSSG